jgi:hypothetical protein
MLVKDMPVAAVARLLNEHDTRLWRIVHCYVDEARSRVDLSAVRSVGVDETASKRGHDYITLFVDLKGSKLVFATEGRNAETLSTFRADLEAHGGQAEQIKDFCIDMSPAASAVWRTLSPWRRSPTTDSMSCACSMRRSMKWAVRNSGNVPNCAAAAMSGSRTPEHLTHKRIEISDELHLPSLNLKTVRAYHLELALPGLLEPTLRTRGEFPPQMVRLCGALSSRPHRSFRTHAARTLDRCAPLVPEPHHQRLARGPQQPHPGSQGKARGYCSTRNLIAIAYLIAGKLDALVETGIHMKQRRTRFSRPAIKDRESVIAAAVAAKNVKLLAWC